MASAEHGAQRASTEQPHAQHEKESTESAPLFMVFGRQLVEMGFKIAKKMKLGRDEQTLPNTQQEAAVADQADEKPSEFSGRRWEMNFHMVSIFVGLNHAAEDVFLIYGSEIYRDATLSNKCFGLTFVTWMLSSLFLAAPISKKLGPKALVVLGLLFYSIQYIVYIIICFLPPVTVVQMVIGIFGAICAGFGSTCMYAGEGTFFANTAQVVAKLDERDLSEVNTSISSVFGFWYLLIEFLAKIAFFGLREIGFNRIVIFFAITVLGVAATAAVWMFVVQPPRQAKENCTEDSEGESEESVVTWQDAFQTVFLWQDARIWLISFLVIAFGMAGAWLNGGIANLYVAPQLGSVWKSLFSSLVALVAAVIQVPFTFVAVRFGKGVALAMGAVSAILLSTLPWLLDMQHLGGWLVMFYILQGIIRGNYATTTKAIYADHFPEPDSDAAFGNWSMQAALGFSVVYIMEGYFDVKTDSIAKALAVVGILIMPGYWAALILQRRWTSEEQQDESDATQCSI